MPGSEGTIPFKAVKCLSVIQVMSFPVLVKPWFMIVVKDFTPANYIVERTGDWTVLCWFKMGEFCCSVFQLEGKFLQYLLC